MKKLQITLGLVLVVVLAVAQDFEVPDNVKLETAEDYAKYEKDILACIKWTLAQPPKKNQAKKDKAFAFFMKWLEGAPNVTVELKASALEVSKKNSGMLTAFLMGWTRYALEHPESEALDQEVAAFDAVLDYYKKFKDQGLKKDKNIEKLLKKRDNGKLKDWVKEQQ